MHSFWFFAGFNSIYPLEKMIQWCFCFSSSFFFLFFIIIDNVEALGCILNDYWNLCILFYILYSSKLTVPPQRKSTCHSCIVNLFSSITSSLSCLGTSWQYQLCCHCFYAYLQASWAWNKDIVLLYSIVLYSKVHKITTAYRRYTRVTMYARHMK